ncbi:helix-turn-helix transcriptional regulator [Romboutsia lituseburensis]|uniref:helix-turn-helix transcriptional regulator n=1 Tax=Romboutsia lituseburensis TaxID=1537 RepID=UPI00215B301C|nr:helix-turn-helix domain-containing protein [Romboutsia lituseburensis]MCR8743693.1 helix-turn-helix domain-containing protein [Romboutsia lituseburensis]
MKSNLIQKRKKKKMTQQEVADKVSICRTHYNRIESGDRNPSHMVAVKIKNVLDCNYEDIFKTN